jgi:hypothetical protein
VVAVAVSGCGSGSNDDAQASDQAAARCRSAASAIARLPRPRTASALSRTATRASRAIETAVGAPDEDLKPVQAAAGRLGDSLRDLGTAPGGDPFARDQAVGEVERHARALSAAVDDDSCRARLGAGVELLRTIHFRLAVTPLAKAVDPAKVRLDDNSLLGTGNHFLFAVDQYHSAISLTLERVQSVRAPTKARAANRAYLRELRRLGDVTGDLYSRGWPGSARAHREAAALRRQASKVDRAYGLLRQRL